MSFTLEDGTGVAGANAYVDDTFVTTYLTDRGRETENGWDGLTTAEKQEKIVSATDYVEKVFGHRWKGLRNSSDQGLSWPRYNALSREGYYYASDAIPVPLQQAVAEYAVRAASSTLLPDPTVDSTGKTVIEKQLGPLRKKFAEGSSVTIIVRPYPAADKILRDLLVSVGRVTR